MNAVSYLPQTRVQKPDLARAAQRRAHQVAICHIASGDGWGGAEVQILALVTELRKRPEVSVSAIVLNSGRLSEELEHAQVDVTVVPERRYSFLELLRRVERVVQAQQIQILHSHRYKENLIATLLKLRYPSLYLVRTQHGRPESLSGAEGIKQRAVHTLDRLTARCRTDRVISVSSDLSRYLDTYVRREKIFVIPNGLDLDRTSCRLAPSEAKRKLQLTAPVIGFVGRLERVKRLDLFIEAAGRILQRIPSAQFVIAGKGREHARVEGLVSSSGFSDRIRLLGHLDNTSELLRAIDLLLITSDHEGLPMVVLEAMALGTPVLARAVGGIGELIRDGHTGWLVDSSDPRDLAEASIRALSDEGRREAVSKAARKRIETKFSAPRNADQVLALYHSLVPVDSSDGSAIGPPGSCR